MNPFLVAIVALVAILSSSFAFQTGTQWRNTAVSNTKLFEDFDLNFKSPKIVSSKELYTEKQYRDFIKTYSTDEKDSLIDFILGFFKKGEEGESSPVTKINAPNFANALKPTVSIGVLQEKTAAFVEGSVDAKAFYSVLKGAFGGKLDKVFPDIIASLPQEKADALAKVAK